MRERIESAWSDDETGELAEHEVPRPSANRPDAAEVLEGVLDAPARPGQRPRRRSGLPSHPGGPMTTAGPPGRVLVAGAGGFIGGHLIRALVAAGRDVRGVDLKPLDEWYQRSDGVEEIGR